jgi:predicted DNA-binding protein (UPF0251 family)
LLDQVHCRVPRRLFNCQRPWWKFFRGATSGARWLIPTGEELGPALAELPEGCRAAFVLHDVEGLEHKEVSEVLGIAEGTSKSQVHKARLRLRGLLRKRV